ncbi:hypothetical protein [Polycladidibacter hongkongensis]|uniref:hypothetical protein n=1 Tax=Polycladidibacter hongkongensis TaxID=1647556 RepID=UPI0008302286|nr:hypothetical protein [Pseudovibrio hongkongensis]
MFIASRIACFIAFCLLLWSGPSAAQQPEVPNLEGVWLVKKKDAILWHRDRTNENNSSAKLEIKKQEGPTLEAIYHWAHAAHAGQDHNGATQARSGHDQLIGLIGWNNEQISFVQHPNRGILSGRLINDHLMELTRVESGGYAVVERLILIRHRSE